VHHGELRLHSGNPGLDDRRHPLTPVQLDPGHQVPPVAVREAHIEPVGPEARHPGDEQRHHTVERRTRAGLPDRLPPLRLGGQLSGADEHRVPARDGPAPGIHLTAHVVPADATRPQLSAVHHPALLGGIPRGDPGALGPGDATTPWCCGHASTLPESPPASAGHPQASLMDAGRAVCRAPGIPERENPEPRAQAVSRLPAMRPTLRPATLADADDLVRMRAVMFAVMGASAEQLDAAPWREEAAGWFRTQLPSRGFRAVVAEVDGQVVASACGQRTPLTPSPFIDSGSVGLLFNVATDPAHRGRGLASACTDAVLHWFDTETDVQRVDLFATDLGRPIYEARGFVDCAEPAMRRNRPR